MIIPIFLVLAQTPISVTEIPEPSANRIRVEIVAGLDKLDRKEWAAANALRETLLNGTSGFTGMQLLVYATQAGAPIRVTLAADHMRIGYSVPPTDLKLAVQIADDLMRDASLSENTVKAALDDMPFARRSPWAEVWLPLVPDSKSVTRDDVMKLYRRVFRPDNVSIAVSGSLIASQGRTAFQTRFTTWKPAQDSARRYREPDPISAKQRSGVLTTVRLEGQPVRAVPSVAIGADGGSTNVGTALLACAMLGQGKGCTIYRVLRESLGLSYRQETFLAPSQQGIRPVLAFASANPTAPTIDFRKPLLDAISAWTDQDRTRALAFAHAVVDLDLGLGSLYFAEETPLTESLDDRTFLAAYWRLKTGRVWNWQLMFQEMERTTLDQAKAFATAWVEKGEITAIVPKS